MRILLDGSNPLSQGFARVLRGIVAPGMVPSGVEVYMPCSPDYLKTLGDLDGRITPIEEPALSKEPGQVDKWWEEEYPRLVRLISPDVVFHPAGYMKGDSRSTPVVVRNTTMLPFDLREISRYGLSRTTLLFLSWRRSMARNFRKADGVIFLSHHQQREVRRQVRGIKRSTVVPLGLGPQFRAEASLQRPLNGTIKLLYVSTVFLYKHQWNVVEAVSSLRDKLGLDLRLSLVGGGEPVAQQKLTRKIEELGAASYTEVIGGLPPEEMPAVYRNADVFVFASSCEGFPNTLLEAMGSGLPIACSDRVGLPEILRDGGVYFDPEKPTTIASAIRRLVDEPELRFGCAARAHRYAGEYTWERAAEEMYGFLEDIARARPGE